MDAPTGSSPRTDDSGRGTGNPPLPPLATIGFEITLLEDGCAAAVDFATTGLGVDAGCALSIGVAETIVSVVAATTVVCCVPASPPVLPPWPGCSIGPKPATDD